MAQFELRGSRVGEWADALTVNSVSTMKPLQARYNIFCNPRGGAMDDVLFYRLPERWLLVVNAANANKMWPYLSSHAEPEARLTNVHGQRALIAVQGPRAVEIVAALADIDCRRNEVLLLCGRAASTACPAIVARTGYTGEDGFELFLDGADAPRIWRRLLEAGAPHGLEPAGLGARDMLRLEAGMPLYGFELAEDVSPLAGGQGWAVKMSKPQFVGKEALAAQLAADDYSRIAGLEMDGRVPARGGYPSFSASAEPAKFAALRSHHRSGNRNIATALVTAEAAAVGTKLDVEIRGARHPATVVTLPFYRRPS